MSKKSININDEEQELFVDEEIDTGLSACSTENTKQSCFHHLALVHCCHFLKQ